MARRASHPWLAKQDGVRLIHGESDGLPGVIADRFGPVVVVQLTSAGADKWRDAIVAGLIQATGCSAVYERSIPTCAASKASAPERHQVRRAARAAHHRRERRAHGGGRGRRPQDRLLPRPARNRLLTGQLAAGREVLNCFCYTGGFSLQALAGGAKHVVSIDSSGPALATAARNVALNPQLDASRAEWREDDVFQALRSLKAEGRKFDLIILDPPKFAPSAAHADRAARAWDINLLGFRLLNPGGILMTYSCSAASAWSCSRRSSPAPRPTWAWRHASCTGSRRPRPSHWSGGAGRRILEGLACQV